MDFTTCSTTDAPGVYSFTQVPQGDFWETLVHTKHVLYDWGRDEIWVCREPFTVSYSEGLAKLETGSRDPNLWLTCGGWAEWHEALQGSFTGSLGMSSTDLCMAFLNSGLELDITGTETYGPKHAGEFLTELKGSVCVGQ